MICLIGYFFVGGIAAVVDFVLFAALVKWFGLAWYYASVVSFTLATLVNYVLSIRFIFESEVRFAKRYEIALVFLASAMGLAVNQAALSCRGAIDGSAEFNHSRKPDCVRERIERLVKGPRMRRYTFRPYATAPADAR